MFTSDLLSFLTRPDLVGINSIRCFPAQQVKGRTLHAALYPVDELVGLAAVQQGSDRRQRVQDDGLGVSVDVVLRDRHSWFTREET